MNLIKRYFPGGREIEFSRNFRWVFIRTAVLVILFLAAVYFIKYNGKQEFSTRQLLNHTREVIFESEKAISLVTDYEANARGFVISNNEEFLQNGRGTKDSVKKVIDNLEALTSDNSLQKPVIDSLRRYILQRFLLSDSSIRLRKDSGLAQAMALVSTGIGKRCMDTLKMLEQHIQHKENKLLLQRTSANNKAAFINKATLFLSLLLFFIVLVVLFWQAWFNLKEYNNRQKEVNGILSQLAQGLMNAQKIAGVGSWEWNIIANEVKWSDEQYRIFGYEPGSVKISHDFFLNAIYSPDRQMVESTIIQAIDKRKSYNIYFRIVQPNGMIRNVHALGEVNTEKGHPLILSGTIQDITAQVIKEKEKLQLTQVLDTTNKAARVGWWEADILTGKRKWSSVTKEILEVSEDFEPEGNFNYLFIEDLESRKRMEKAFSDAVLKGIPYDIILNVVTAKGNLLPLRAIGQSEFEDGHCIRVYGSFQALDGHISSNGSHEVAG